MRVILEGAEQDVPSEELEPETSRHTGRLLHRRRVSFRAPAALTDEITAAFASAREEDGALVEPGGVNWVVVGSSYSYSDNDRVHVHEAELREAETLRPERLEIAGISVVPTKYAEKFDSDSSDSALFVYARVDVDPDTDAALERLITSEPEDAYFDVRRIGISDDPIRMRFGRCLWQSTEEGRAHLLRLVSEQGDTEQVQRGIRWHEPEMSHLMRKAAVAEEAIEGLLTELEAAGVLTATTTEHIRTRMAEAPKTRDREFDETRDLETYF
jgi:hypothetical protein